MNVFRSVFSCESRRNHYRLLRIFSITIKAFKIVLFNIFSFQKANILAITRASLNWEADIEFLLYKHTENQLNFIGIDFINFFFHSFSIVSEGSKNGFLCFVRSFSFKLCQTLTKLSFSPRRKQTNMKKIHSTSIPITVTRYQHQNDLRSQREGEKQNKK